MTDGFDIDFNANNRNSISSQTSKEDVTLSDPGNCDALGLESTFEKVLDFTYERGSKVEIELDRDIGLLPSCLEVCARRGSECLGKIMKEFLA